MMIEISVIDRMDKQVRAIIRTNTQETEMSIETKEEIGIYLMENILNFAEYVSKYKPLDSII